MAWSVQRPPWETGASARRNLKWTPFHCSRIIWWREWSRYVFVDTLSAAFLPRWTWGSVLRRRALGFAVSLPTLLRSFPYGFQTGRRQPPLLGLRRFCWLGRFGLLFLLRRPSRPQIGRAHV